MLLSRCSCVGQEHLTNDVLVLDLRDSLHGRAEERGSHLTEKRLGRSRNRVSCSHLRSKAPCWVHWSRGSAAKE